MKDEDYISTQSGIINICVDANKLNLNEFLERIEDAETISPKLFLKGEKDLIKIKKLAQAIKVLQCSIRSILAGGNDE